MLLKNANTVEDMVEQQMAGGVGSIQPLLCSCMTTDCG